MPLRASKLHNLKGSYVLIKHISSDKQSEAVLWEHAQPHRSRAPHVPAAGRGLGRWQLLSVPGWEVPLILQHRCTCLRHPGALWPCSLSLGLEEARKDSQDRQHIQVGPAECHTQRGTAPSGPAQEHNRATLQRSKISFKVLYQSKWKFCKWGCQNLNCSAGSPYASFGHKYHQGTAPKDTHIQESKVLGFNLLCCLSWRPQEEQILRAEL